MPVKKVAVMQPYIFPYLGYFQLANAVDEFIFLDDVTFIKSGYINRNSILLGGQTHRFVLPVHDISSFRTIREHRYLDTPQKFLDLLRHAYHKAPCFETVYTLVADVLSADDRSVAAVNGRGVIAVFQYLGIDKVFHFSSLLDPASGLIGEERVIRLCEHRHSSIYINAAGGRTLYDSGRFASKGLALGFIQSRFAEYRQKAPNFVPGLSIIDVLMWNAPEQVVAMLDDCAVDFPSPERSE